MVADGSFRPKLATSRSDPLATLRTMGSVLLQMLMRAALAVLILIAGRPISVGQLSAQKWGPMLPSESDFAFASSRYCEVPEGTSFDTLTASGNGVPTIFVDYRTVPETVCCRNGALIALHRPRNGACRKAAGHCGRIGTRTSPDIEAIGFANVDRDPAKATRRHAWRWNEPATTEHAAALMRCASLMIAKPSKASLRPLPDAANTSA